MRAEVTHAKRAVHLIRRVANALIQNRGTRLGIDIQVAVVDVHPSQLGRLGSSPKARDQRGSNEHPAECVVSLGTG